jgi:hypothetical protein
MTARLFTGLLAALTVLGLVGCGGAAAPAAAPPDSAVAPARPALPPRPVELRLDGVDPCALLTDAQQKQLGVGGGSAVGVEASSGPLRGPSCTWDNFPKRPSNGYFGRAVLTSGAEFGLGSEPLRTVDGFAATTAGSTGTDPAYYCNMLVDVAPGQALGAQYDNNAHDYPGMNHQLACDKAQQLASAMLTTLRAIKQR